MLSRTLMLMVLLLLAWPRHSEAQYIFLDANRDGVGDSRDQLRTGFATSVDVWIRTDANRDGSRAICASRSSVPLSIFHYEFILHATGGTVEWGKYTNLQPTMDFCLGEFKTSTDYYTGFLGGPPLPPGKYKLGTLSIRVASGAPHIGFTSKSPTWYYVQTSFGSMNPGKEGCNTLIYADDPSDIAKPWPGAFGDWGDGDGIGTNGIAFATDNSPPMRFEVSVAPNPLNPDAIITVSTTRIGFLRVRLFDVHGRLVRLLADEESTQSGHHPVRLSAGKPHRALTSGVYFYSVDAAEGRIDGRIVVLK